MNRRHFLATTAALGRHPRGGPCRAAPRARPSTASSSGSAAAWGSSTRSTPNASATTRAGRRPPGRSTPRSPRPWAACGCASTSGGRPPSWTASPPSARSTTRSSTNTPSPPTCVHTGRMVSGTVTYPSIGSIVAHQRGAASPDVPAYMLIGYPNVSRGPGFLGLEARLRLPHRHRVRPGRVHPPRPRRRRPRRTRERLLKSLGTPPGGRVGRGRLRGGPGRGDPARRAAVHAALRPQGRAGRPARAVTAASSASAASSPAGWSRPGCGSSRCRTT